MRQTIHVSNKLQNYTYERTKPAGKNFDSTFEPELSPPEMLSLGVFGGAYFSDTGMDEFPATWKKDARISETGKRDRHCNYFDVNASQSRAQWAKSGWLYADDPLGWFQWYCRYYLGRRIPAEDARQIRRWKNIVRHLAQIRANCRRQDMTCRPVQRQALLHWAYDSRKI